MNLKICFRAVLDVVKLAYRQETDALVIIEQVFLLLKVHFPSEENAGKQQTNDLLPTKKPNRNYN